MTLPKGWDYATALETESRVGDKVTFKPIDYEDLVDSPLFAGKHHQRIVLAEGKQPVALNVFADDAKSLKPTPEQIKIHQQLVQQMDKLYGARHFDHYEFLLALTDKLGGIGLEHHRSSENSGPVGYFTEWDKSWWMRDLLSHEFNHSWNGKYRRGADLATPKLQRADGRQPVVAVRRPDPVLRSGGRRPLGGPVRVPSKRATCSPTWPSTYDRGRPGLAWRNIQDTTNDPTIAERRPLAFRNYPDERGLLLRRPDGVAGSGWQAARADRQQAVDRRLRACLLRHEINGEWKVNPYTFEDIAGTLNGIAPYDWATFLKTRVEGHGSLVGGIEAAGWKLVYNDKPNEAFKALETRSKGANLTYSLGLATNATGLLTDVLWDGPAFKAGLAPGMTIVAVNGREYGNDTLKDAVTEAKDGKAPIELLVKQSDRYETVRIDYHGGLLYPNLERIAGKPDRLTQLYKAR